MQRHILHTHYFEYPPEVIWSYLTKPEKLSWLMENDIKPEVGAEFMFRTKARIKVGFDGNIFCKVIEVVPYEKLSYSWKGGPGDGTINLDTIVIWSMVRQGGGTLLTLEHKGFHWLKNLIPFLVMRMGWERGLKVKLTKALHKNEK
ncbi:MAG: SRPBCC family protein [Chitinophagaceae bacterium]